MGRPSAARRKPLLLLNQPKETEPIAQHSDARRQRLLQARLASDNVLACNPPRRSSLGKNRTELCSVRNQFPGLITGWITSYGSTGPYAARRGYDRVAQGEAGLMSITGRDSAPMRYTVPPVLATRNAAGWLAQLKVASHPCGPTNPVPDFLTDSHYAGRGNLVELEHTKAGRLRSLATPFRLSDTTATYRPPPTVALRGRTHCSHPVRSWQRRCYSRCLAREGVV